MDTTLFISTMFGSLLGSAGLFGLVQFLINRHDNRKTELKTIRKELIGIRNMQDNIIVRVTRGELKDLIRNDPTNIDAILQVAEYYFVQLGGNAYAHAMFEKWAHEQGVSIGWLPTLSKKKGGNNGTKI